ncbi:MAG: response regulator transcription factor [Planctomycetota bacterium]|jgi:CheY-like chemotaxis protein
MAGEPGGDEPSARPGPLERLSLRTKALVIANEYTHRQMSPNELRDVLVALAPTPEEQEQVASAVEEELRAARYPVGEVLRLMGELVPKGAAAESTDSPEAPAPDAEAPPEETGDQADGTEGRAQVTRANPSVIVTRKVRAPHLMPFERFEFEATPEGLAFGASAEPADAASPADVETREAGPAPPTRQMPVAGAKAHAAEFRFVAGGESAPSAAQDDSAALAAASGKPVVVVADDDARARVIYRVKLEEAGFAVIEAKDGVEAWKQIKSGAIHGIVMDMKMPGYHGLEVLSRMVDAGIDMPVVVVSAFDQLADEFIVATYPKLTFLTKPASPDEVTASVMKLLYADG